MNGRLYRSRDDRMLAGVAGGLAEYWDADPSLVRIIWALLVLLTGGIALVIYIVMAFIVPDEDELTYTMPTAPTSPPAPDRHGSDRRSADRLPNGPHGADGRTRRVDPPDATAALFAVRDGPAGRAPRGS